MPLLGATQFAIYPGSVTLYDGTVRSFTALELATAYGVQDEDYLIVTGPLEIPTDMTYIHLKPRQDDYYEDWKEYSLHDGEEVTLGPDFDGDRKYTDETDPEKMRAEADIIENPDDLI